jgi:hypothetical protein
MDHAGAAKVAFRVHRVLDSLHSSTYFAPETEQHLTKVGLRPGRMCYFAGRSAPFGAIWPGAVAATFYNFNAELVARHIPRAWTLATPTQELITHTATGNGFLEGSAKASRGWSDEQWAVEVDNLRARGLLDVAGQLTEQGTELRGEIEDTTNRAAAAPWLHLGAEKTDRLHDLDGS